MTKLQKFYMLVSMNVVLLAIMITGIQLRYIEQTTIDATMPMLGWDLVDSMITIPFIVFVGEKLALFKDSGIDVVNSIKEAKSLGDEDEK